MASAKVKRIPSGCDLQRPQSSAPIRRVDDAVGGVEGHLERAAAERGAAGPGRPGGVVALAGSEELGAEHRGGVEARAVADDVVEAGVGADERPGGAVVAAAHEVRGAAGVEGAAGGA